MPEPVGRAELHEAARDGPRSCSYAAEGQHVAPSSGPLATLTDVPGSGCPNFISPLRRPNEDGLSPPLDQHDTSWRTVPHEETFAASKIALTSSSQRTLSLQRFDLGMLGAADNGTDPDIHLGLHNPAAHRLHAQRFPIRENLASSVGVAYSERC